MQFGNVVIYYVTNKSSMRTKNSTMVFFTIALVLGSVAGLSSFANTIDVFAKHEQVASLSGQEEVPPVDTQATGMAEFTPVAPTNETVDFNVNATDIQGVTAGHIHSGAVGENGEVVVTLFTFDTPQDMVSENGTITADMLEGEMQGMTIADLITAMKDGNTYVNFHTEQNPSGEIRGQIMGISQMN
ncbi:MAG: CHRD domain-containing protein [Candidatus Nitrosocosmicus sp.]|nr:CHRD domain-containing protein [Candidatus Nitrosocosmicus sp.]